MSGTAVHDFQMMAFFGHFAIILTLTVMSGVFYVMSFRHLMRMRATTVTVIKRTLSGTSGSQTIHLCTSSGKLYRILVTSNKLTHSNKVPPSNISHPTL